MLTISVIVPCLNRANYLRATLDSILSQDYPRTECIVRDGGSTDGTQEILKSYGDKIRWTSEKDGGQAEAINKGFRESTGEIVTWLNADDLWAPGAARAAAEWFEQHPETDVLHGDCDLIDLDSNAKGPAHVTPWNTWHWLDACDYCITQPASFIHRRILDRVGLLDTSYILIDLELWSRIARSGTIHYRKGLLAHARSHSDYDRRRFAQDQVRLTRAFFEADNCPEKFVQLRHRAISSAFVQAAEYERESPKKSAWRVAWFLLQALIEDPTNFQRVWSKAAPALRKRFCGGAA